MPLPPKRALERGGLIVALAGIAAAGAVVLWLGFGGFDPSATRPHGRLTFWAIHAVMITAVHHRAARIRPPAMPGPDHVVAGFRQYDAECARCHGGPGVPRAAWADRLSPSPPFLIEEESRWTRPELFWIVCHGVKMTAMPAWGPGRSDQDLWDIVAFLRAMPYLTARQYQDLRRAYGGRPMDAGRRGVDAACLSSP